MIFQRLTIFSIMKINNITNIMARVDVRPQIFFSPPRVFHLDLVTQFKKKTYDI